MRLTTKTDYCLRVLIYLQGQKDRVKIQDIAKTFGVSKNHLSVVVNKLSELEYITSVPGPHGGILFNPAASHRTVAELATQVESFDLVECFDRESNACILTSHCKLKGILKKATNAFVKELQNYKIKDLV